MPFRCTMLFGTYVTSPLPELHAFFPNTYSVYQKLEHRTASHIYLCSMTHRLQSPVHRLGLKIGSDLRFPPIPVLQQLLLVIKQLLSQHSNKIQYLNAKQQYSPLRQRASSSSRLGNTPTEAHYNSTHHCVKPQSVYARQFPSLKYINNC